MAYVPNQPDPNQQNQPNAGMPNTGIPNTGLAPVATSSAPGAGPSAGGQGGAGPTNQNPGQPFTNLSSYLTANAPQIQKQADTISGNLNTQYGALQGQIDQGAQNVNATVQSAYTPPNQGVIDQATADPVKFAQDPNNVKQFQSLLNNQYTGPSSFETTPDYATINQDVTKGVANANLLNTPEGVQTYLRNNSTTNPTAGDNLLDSVLLQGSPEAYKGVQAAANKFNSLPSYLSGQATTIDQGVTAAQQAADQSRQAAQAGLEGTEGTFNKGLNDELSQATGDYQSYIQHANDLQNVLNQPATSVLSNTWGAQKVDPLLINALSNIGNFNSNDAMESLSVPLGSRYLSPVTMPNIPGQSDVATDKDVAMANALGLLSGGSFTPPVTSPGKWALPSLPTIDQGKMGSELYNLVSSVTPNFTNATNPGTALQAYKSALAALQQYLGIPVTDPNALPPSQPPNGGHNNDPLPPPAGPRFGI